MLSVGALFIVRYLQNISQYFIRSIYGSAVFLENGGFSFVLKKYAPLSVDSVVRPMWPTLLLLHAPDS